MLYQQEGTRPSNSPMNQLDMATKVLLSTSSRAAIISSNDSDHFGA